MIAKNKKIKVAIVGSNGLPGRYGGWDQLMEHITRELHGKFEFYVYTSSHNAIPGLTHHNKAKLHVLPLKANGYQSVVYDGVSMFHAAIKYDVMLILGTSGCIFLPLVKLLSSRKIVLNPDGAEWKRGKWNKYIKSFLKFSEKCGVKYSHCVISDNKVMDEYLTKEYSVQTTLIAYGGDNATPITLSSDTKDLYGISEKTYVFKVCRIEPENNVEMVLDACSKAGVKLIFVGNWKNSEFGIRLREKYSEYSDLILLDAIYDQSKLDELRSNCGVYAHGHSVGGTNPSLVEAMSLGLACVVFNVNYNVETTENRALYFSTSSELQFGIKEILSDADRRQAIGCEMHEIAGRRYRWKHIVDCYSQLLEVK